MEKKRVTMALIAAKAGVSQMTVSMALRNHPRISEGTRQRIQELAATMGYRPDPVLSRLMAHLRSAGAGAKTETVAYLVSRGHGTAWRKTYLGLMFDGAVARAATLGYKLEVLDLEEPGMTTHRMNTILRSRGIEGVLIAPRSLGGSHLRLNFAHLAAAHVGATLWRPALHSAHHDYFHGTMLMMRNLVRHGYRRIGFVSSRSLARTTGHQEEAAFLYYGARLRESPVPPLLLPEWDTPTFLAWHRRYRPDAIATCYLDVKPALREAGYAAPDSVGIALNWLPPGDTSAGIRQDFEATGATAFDLVESQLRRHEHGVPAQPKAALIRGQWVEGDSVANVANTH